MTGTCDDDDYYGDGDDDDDEDYVSQCPVLCVTNMYCATLQLHAFNKNSDYPRHVDLLSRPQSYVACGGQCLSQHGHIITCVRTSESSRFISIILCWSDVIVCA